MPRYTPSFFTVVLGAFLLALGGAMITAQQDILVPVYTNARVSDGFWSADSLKFAFWGGSSDRIGVDLATPDWLQYDLENAEISRVARWPFRPVLTDAEAGVFTPMSGSFPTLMFLSPDERFLVYTVNETQELAVADRHNKTQYVIPNFVIPSPNFGTDEFLVLWSADSTAFALTYVPAYGENFGAYLVYGFTSASPQMANHIEGITVGSIVAADLYRSTGIADRWFRDLAVHDISTDGTQVLVSGREVCSDCEALDQDTRAKLLLIDIVNPEESKVFDSLSGVIAGASIDSVTEDDILVVNEMGLVRYTRTNDEISIVDSRLAADGSDHAKFSPNGNSLAFFQTNESNISLFIVSVPTGN